MSEWRLAPLAGAPRRPGPLLLVIMDGVGLGRGDEGDAVALARTPTLDRLFATCPHLRLRAHGTAVGMPSDRDMGNSEVGHNAMGCGRVFDQGAKLVDRAIANGALFRGDVWREIMGLSQDGGTLHLIGLLSDGKVHSHIDHLVALVREADRSGVARVRVHALLDGRDVGETSALEYVDALEKILGEIDDRKGRSYRIASGGGRMLVTMDRYEADWSIVERGWRVHVLGDARRFPTARKAIETFREEDPGVIDQFLPAFVIADGDRPVGPVRDGDAVVLFNFRGDRAIGICRAFEQDRFPHFRRERRPDVFFAGMMEYDGDLHLPGRYLVEPPAIDRTLGEYLVRNGVPQLAAAETQKYGHVTYFWNGNCTGLLDPETGGYVEVPPETVGGEPFGVLVRRTTMEAFIEVDSDRVPFEQRPWMKAAEVTDVVIRELRTGESRFARVNFANGDMVGHTGNLEATIAAVAAVDICVHRLLGTIEELDGLALILADHGNADEMLTPDGEPKTSHTLNPVPLILFDPRGPGALGLDASIEDPGLANVTATILGLLRFEAPEDYHPSLLAR